MLSFARATFLLGVQLLAARAAQYTSDEIEDIFDGLKNRKCTGFELCNPEWTEATFDGWQKRHLFALIECQMEMNYDILDRRTVEIVKEDLNDNSLDRMHFVYNVFDFSDDVVEAGECSAHDASAPAPVESLDTLCGSVGYYGKCHPDWTKSSVREYSKFALKELIPCQTERFEDILDDDDDDSVLTFLNNMNKDALERTALEFNDIANAEYCGGAGAGAPNDDMPDNAPSSGYIYSSIGGVVAAACAYLIGN